MPLPSDLGLRVRSHGGHHKSRNPHPWHRRVVQPEDRDGESHQYQQPIARLGIEPLPARIRGNPAIGKPWRPTEDLVSRRSKRHLVSVIIQVDDRGGGWLWSGGLLATPLTISIQSFAEVYAVWVLGFRLEVLDIPLD